MICQVFAQGAKMINNLDDIDREVLRHLQQDARMTNAELARRVDLSPPGLQKRLRKLEESGIIEGSATIVSREAVGYATYRKR